MSQLQLPTNVAAYGAAASRARPKSTTSLINYYAGREGVRVALFLGAHALLGLVLNKNPTGATLHALLVLAVGMFWALFSPRAERVAYVGAYITGAEVLWRMTSAGVNWEFAKYAIVLVFLIRMIRLPGLKWPALPFIYFTLLLPSCALTIANPGLIISEWMGMLSFILSGSLTLVVCAWFFFNLKLSPTQLQRLFIVLMAPIISIATVAFYSMVTRDRLVFYESSMLSTSGGFGPNQVSTILGLGALLALLGILDKNSGRFIKGLLLGTMLFLAVQCALTFSRSGLYNAAMGAVAAILFLIKDPRARARFAVLAGSLFVVTYFFIIPLLDAFTGGAIISRFESLDTTGRTELAMIELNAWFEHPLLGVGPGQMRTAYEEGFRSNIPTHTEYTRLLAEHGFFGLIALLILFTMLTRNLFRSRTDSNKAVAAALIGWGLLYMLGAAMRLAAPSFILGVTFVTITTKNAKEIAPRLARQFVRRNAAPSASG